ncbi:hypothetical protein [Aliiroseovarius subalbicans]|uniref:hypothetical protein n=1 Tax=Aliiroseovarius subalbicans TaxID=2925840 RepID=UPI001F5A9BAC|nr:hypothetical protein [Aliiroseovarius subalbicans]MCI2398988.1 hypothetical protein [Aliiroseovarius subalbicans]
MHVSFHIGAHCTDDDQLVKSLLKNKGRLAAEGIIVPGPSRYRGLLADVLPKLKGARASQDTQDVVLDSVMDVDQADRLVLSHDNFLGAPRRALEDQQLYHLARRNSSWLRNLFPDNPVEFFLSVRNPATFVPALFEQVPDLTFPEFVAGVDLRALYWSDMVHAIREENPDCPVTVWCNEDTPLIWPEVLHEVAGLDPLVRLKGGLDIMAQITAKEGMRRLRAYMKEHPPQNEIQRRRILSAFLDKFALDDEIEEELDLPGWTPKLIDTLTAAYDDDMLELARLPGVTLLTA